jgi:hypothetical protein
MAGTRYRSIGKWQLALAAAFLPGAALAQTPDAASVRGAIYISADAYNAPQMWKNFSAKETDRDLGYAQKIHLNALRTWASYEYWRQDPAKFQANFDQYLAIAQRHGIRILVSLFENDGVQPTEENLWTTDPHKAFAIQSPGKAIVEGPETGWEAPRDFVTWFMKRYGSDKRLIAIEVMNEPRRPGAHDPASMPFAKSMLMTAKDLHGSIPLTMGTQSISDLGDYIPGIDLIEFHDNFPPNTQQMEATIADAIAFGQKNNMPVWLTEWQRLRPGGPGWAKGKMAPSERNTDYASLAALVNGKPIGTFFWSLMVKRAYLPGQRFNGTVNGLFWPDGSVVNLGDARAIAGDPSLQLKEKKIPDTFGMEAVK